MAFLSTPANFTPPTDNVTEIIKLIEDKFAMNRVFDKYFQKDAPGYYFKRVTIDGHYPPDDCREVCKRYQNAGWEEVYFHTVPQTISRKETTFTFKAPK